MKKENLFVGKVAWITGASSGIGEALVHEFSKRGATVIASSNDLPGLEKVKSDCGDRSVMVHCVTFDLADTSGIDKIVELQVNTFGKIDYLLNIGGISQRARIDETPLWLDRKIFEINYFGTIAFPKLYCHIWSGGNQDIYSQQAVYQEDLDFLSGLLTLRPNRLYMGLLKHSTLKIKYIISELL